MIKSIINFFTTYNSEVWKPYRKWMKKHRLGFWILWLCIWLPGALYYYKDEIDFAISEIRSNIKSRKEESY